MGTLSNPRHEAFAVEYARTGNGRQSYITAGYSEHAADACASRLLTDAKVAARVAELRAELTERVIAAEISDRNARVAALQDRWDRMKALLNARAAEHASVPGGSSGLLVKQLKKIGSGPKADVVEEYSIDGVLLRELRAHEEQAARELGQWVERHEEASDVETILGDARARLAAMPGRELAGEVIPDGVGGLTVGAAERTQ